MKKYGILRLFLKLCALAFISFFLIYLALDLVLAGYLSGLEKEHKRDVEFFNSTLSTSSSGRTLEIGSTREICRIINCAGFNLLNYGMKGNNRSVDSFFSMNHRYLEMTLEKPDESIQVPGELMAADIEKMDIHLRMIRNVLLREEDPLWAGEYRTEVDLLKVGQVGEWLAAAALVKAERGELLEAELCARSLLRLSLSLLSRRDQSYWVTAASLVQTYSGLLRKIGKKCPGLELAEIAPYSETLGGLILDQSARMIEGTRDMQSIKYFKFYKRERMLWRTYGRLWFRYSLIRQIRFRHADFSAWTEWLSCPAMSQADNEVLERSFWMTNGSEFRIRDMRHRLQSIACSLEFTKWILSGEEEAPSAGLLACPGITVSVHYDNEGSTIGYKMPFRWAERRGVIDLPTTFFLPQGGNRGEADGYIPGKKVQPTEPLRK